MSLSQPRTSNPSPCQKWYEIALSRGRVAIVDADDYQNVSQFKWSFDGEYAKRAIKVGVNKWKYQRLHNFLMGQLPKGFEVDHVNGKKLDNRRSNLRAATRIQNRHNTRTLRRNNKCGRVGVHFRPQTGKWIAQIKLGKMNRNLGSFITMDDAIQAREKAEKELHGQFAITN